MNKQKHKEIEEYKVGMLINKTFGIYLVVRTLRGYSLVNLDNSELFVSFPTLSELFSQYHCPNDYEVNATLTIEGE